jgi:hypothetical protein
MARRAIALALLVAPALAGCKREPDFSERYDAASKQIDAAAQEIDAELADRAKAAGADDARPTTEPIDD